MSRLPLLSVIVISHNRADQLAECVRLIASQCADNSDVELIIVLDNCVDGSLVALDSLRPLISSRLVVESIRANSPAASRNRGASLARGSILLFLDDDILPSPGLLVEHIASHEKSDAVVGYLKPCLTRKHDWWQLGARVWWEDRFSVMRRDGYTPGYRDLFSANFSVKSSLFHSCGGFDRECPRLEDYEFGIRLLKAGAVFTHNPMASAVHLESGNLRQWLRRAALEAVGELHIGRKHPDFRASVFRERFGDADQKVVEWKARVRAVAFKRSGLVDASVRLAAFALPFLELSKARVTWRHFMGGVHEYNYWRCIAHHFPDESTFLSWVKN